MIRPVTVMVDPGIRPANLSISTRQGVIQLAPGPGQLSGTGDYVIMMAAGQPFLLSGTALLAIGQWFIGAAVSLGVEP